MSTAARTFVAASLYASALVASLALRAAPAHAQERAHPAVRLAFEGDWDAALMEEVARHMRATLERQALSLLDELSPGRPAAAVHLALADGARLRIEVIDLIQDKHVVRVVDLVRAPRDTWGILIAASSDELVRAAWLEIELVDAPEPERVPPDEVREIVDRSLHPPAAARTFGLSASAAVDGFTGGVILVGGDVRVGFVIADPVTLEVRAGARGMVPLTTPLGRIEAFAVGGGLGAAVELLREGPFALETVASIDVFVLGWRPAANAGASSADDDAPLVTADAGLRFSADLDDVRVALRVGAGAPIVAAIATADLADAGGASGLWLGARLEAGWWPR